MAGRDKGQSERREGLELTRTTWLVGTRDRMRKQRAIRTHNDNMAGRDKG